MEPWKKKAVTQQLKITELEGIVASLHSEDHVQDQKLENLNKLHAQKVRALMNSIQDLKKQLAAMRAQGKEHNRSKLIEKLKTELAQQEIAIKAVRDLANDEAACDAQIIAYLNKGPPRFRPLSREEMRIEIAQLKKRLNSKTSAAQADRAVDSLSQQFPAEASSEQFLDPLQNEKIEELYLQIEDYKIELRAKEYTVSALRRKLRETEGDIALKGTEQQVAALKNRNFGELQDKYEAELKTMHSQGDLQELTISLKATRQELNELKTKFSGLQTDNARLAADRNKAIALAKDFEQQLRGSDQDDKLQYSSFTETISEQAAKIAALERELLNKDLQLVELQKTLKDKELEQSQEGKDIEIAVLRAKVQNLINTTGVPEAAISAERAEALMYKQKAKELAREVAELQEEVEFLQHNSQEERKHSSAVRLKDQKFGGGSTEELLHLKRLKVALEEQNDRLQGELGALQRELNYLKKKDEVEGEKRNRLRKSVLSDLEASVKLDDRTRANLSQELVMTLRENAEYRDTIENVLRPVVGNFDLVIPSVYNHQSLQEKSTHIARRLLNFNVQS